MGELHKDEEVKTMKDKIMCTNPECRGKNLETLSIVYLYQCQDCGQKFEVKHTIEKV
jgi:predicted SprT family Zn-dependent metalloprotease